MDQESNQRAGGGEQLSAALRCALRQLGALAVKFLTMSRSGFARASPNRMRSITFLASFA
jgi:hypothetical protein